MSFLLSDNLCSSFQNVIVRPGTDMMLKVVCADNMVIRLTRLQYRDKSFCATFLLRHHVQLASDRIYRVRPPPLSGNPSLTCPAFQRSDFKQNRTEHFSYIFGLKTYINPKYHFLDVDGLFKLLIPTMTVWWYVFRYCYNLNGLSLCNATQMAVHLCRKGDVFFKSKDARM